MLIKDVKKIEKLKSELEKHPEYQKKIDAIEKKYNVVKAEREESKVRAIYYDKESQVAVMDSGEIIQFKGPRYDPKFLGFVVAYGVLLFVSIAIAILAQDVPVVHKYAQALPIITTAGALVLNIWTFQLLKDIYKKRIVWFVPLVFLLVMNVVKLISLL